MSFSSVCISSTRSAYLFIFSLLSEFLFFMYMGMGDDKKAIKVTFKGDGNMYTLEDE